MDRIEAARKYYMQARKMTIAMGVSVLAYGAIGFYLIHIGRMGPSVFNAQTYLLAKYGALAVSVIGLSAIDQLRNSGRLSLAQPPAPGAERTFQKVFLRTVLMCAGAELPVLLGLILVFLGHKPYDYILFAAVSLAGFSFAFPKKEEWVSWLGSDF